MYPPISRHSLKVPGFKPLNLKCDFLVSKFAFSNGSQLVPLHLGGLLTRGGGDAATADVVKFQEVSFIYHAWAAMMVSEFTGLPFLHFNPEGYGDGVKFSGSGFLTTYGLVGLYRLNPVYPQLSLKAPGLNPFNYKVKTRIQTLLSNSTCTATAWTLTVWASTWRRWAASRGRCCCASSSPTSCAVGGGGSGGGGARECSRLVNGVQQLCGGGGGRWVRRA
jgi:hypothetical protein